MGKKKYDTVNFGYLGHEFQIRLLAHLLVDHHFANTILDILNPNYFSDEYLRIIASKIIDTWEQYEYVPDYAAVEIAIMGDIKNEQIRELTRIAFKEVREASLIGDVDIKDRAMFFCKQQALKSTVEKIQKIIDSGDVDRYPECEDLMRKALELGDNKDDSIDVFHAIDEVLADDFRKPIPTGIHGLDIYMDGGLAPSELGVILAPFGVGKTTMITKIANTAKDLGKNVLQIFFEDNPKVIQRKHLTCWYNSEEGIPNITINELKDNKDMVKLIAAKKKEMPGVIKLKKFPSDGTTINKIRQYVRKLIASGFRPDVILLDYIDCVQSSQRIDDNNVAEGNVMRQFETMLSEFNMVGWTCVQGNRSSINASTVDSSMMGGSIKRGQIGHFIVSIAKTLPQKEEGKANMAILKSRFGKDGIIFEDCLFDNARIIIDTSNAGDGKTFLEAKKEKDYSDEKRVKELLEKRNKLIAKFKKEAQNEIEKNENNNN